MDPTKIRSLLASLKDEIQSGEVDANTRLLLEELDSDLHDVLGASEHTEVSTTLLEKAERLEASFAITHPMAERFARELVNALGTMGV